MSGPNSKNSNQPVDLDASAPSHIIGSATLYASDGSLARSCSGKMTEEVRMSFWILGRSIYQDNLYQNIFLDTCVYIRVQKYFIKC